MKYLRRFNSQEDAIGVTMDMPGVVAINGGNGAHFFGSKDIKQTEIVPGGGGNRRGI